MSDSDDFDRISDSNIRPDSSYSYPTWRVMRREKTETGPKNREANESETEGEEEYYQSRTVTTTERVQILQMPLEVKSGEFSRFSDFIYSPTGETSRQVNSTTTFIEAGSVPVINGLTKDGHCLSGGMVTTNKQKVTTTVITTTTTTYKVIEDPNDDYEVVSNPDADQLTIEIPLIAKNRPMDSAMSFTMIGSQTDSSLSPLTDEDSQEAQVPIYKSAKYRARQTARATKNIPQNSSSSSFEFMEQPTSSSEADEDDYMHVSNEASAYVDRDENVTPREESVCHMEPTTSRRAVEFGSYPIEQFATIYHSGVSHSPQTQPLVQSTTSKQTDQTASEPVYQNWQNIEASTVYDRYRQAEMQTHELHKHVDKPPENIDSGYSINERGRVKQKQHSSAPDYPPIHEPLDYRTNETIRQYELNGHPIEQHVTLYSTGRSDEVKPATPEPSITSKISSLFKKSEKKTESGYPSTEVYEGPINDTNRSYEATHLPIHDHATVYLTSGRSDEAPSVKSSTITEERHIHTDYPAIQEPTNYATDETRRSHELTDNPIEYHVARYSSGRSDDVKPETSESSVASKLTSLFKRGDHESFPTSERYEGPIDETRRFDDIEHLPIHEHATVYLQSGRSDEHRPTTTEIQSVVTEQVQIVTTDYPTIHEPFEYQTDETRRRSEMDGHPLELHVSLYSNGRSDEPKSKTPEPSVASKLTSLFKKSDKKTESDYPTSVHEGPVDETRRFNDIEHLPIHEHATVYFQSGRSDEHRPPTTEEQQPVIVEERVIPTDYPTIHEPFDYQTDETRRRNEMDNLPIEHHVSLYSSGRSDEPKEKTAESVTSKLTSLFKKSDKKTETGYPEMTSYDGPVNETRRFNDIEHLPIREHATVYLESGRSDDYKPTVYQPTITEEQQPVIVEEVIITTTPTVSTDYPTIHEPFDYQTDETRRRSEMDNLPIEHHVSLYSTGRSDEVKSATPEPSITSKISSLFKKGEKKPETGYPTSIHEGPVDEISRYRDIEHLPIHEHATVYLESGRSDEQRPTTEVQPTTTEQVEIVTTDYPTIREPFEYETDKTRRSTEFDGQPIEHHVSLYSSGRSDEPKEKTAESVTSKLTSLFKKSDKKTETGYPEMTSYDGPVNETRRFNDIEHLPIREHATVYLESGRSDDYKPTVYQPTITEEQQPVIVEEVIITTTPTVSTDYPTIHEPFDYQTDETRRRSEMDNLPIEHHVSLYSTGRSDEPKQKSAESVTSKLTSLFKRGHAHESFPTSERYEGPVDETRRFNDIEHLPIHEHATVYLQSGRSDEHRPTTTEVQSVVTEQVQIVTTDYPTIHEPFEYQTDETKRRNEMDAHPIEHHVSLYSTGRSDEPKSATPEPSVASKLTSLFKKSDKKTESDYPTSIHEGPVDETRRYRDIEHLPIHEHAIVYLTSGRSDEHRPTTEVKPLVTKEVEIATTDYPAIHEPFDYQTDETRRSRELDGHPIEHHVSIYSTGRSDEPKQKSTESVTSKLSSLFKRGHAHESFPTSNRYEGPISDTQHQRDIEHLPIHEHATVYLTSGRSDEHRPIEHKPEVTEQVEIVTADYPTIHEPFEYQTDETKRRNEMDAHPIEHHVSLYSTGRSDEPKSATPEPSVASKLTSLFKKSDKKTESGYPTSIHEGPVDETRRYRDIEHLPIHEHATVYLQSGRSDDYKPTVYQPPTTEEQSVVVEEVVITTKPTVSTNYPAIHEPFEYQTDETRRRREMDNLPIEHHVSLYSTGRSDEVKSATPEPSITSKISSLFKKDEKKTETGYPEMATYEGPVNETRRFNDIEHLPINEHATVYLTSGRSDEHRPIEHKPEVTKEVEIETTDYPVITEHFEYQTDKTQRSRELDGHPIEHHVSIYSTGRSDEPKQKSAESVTSKLSSLFKKGEKKTESDYPEMSTYEGPVSETQRYRDIEHLPIHEHASVYLQSGRSDEHRPTTEVQPLTTEEAETVLTDYPVIHEPFEYQTEETRRRSEMDGHPIEHHVSLYSSGQSDEVKSATPEPSITSKISSLFKKSDKKTESGYPSTEFYEGPVDETRPYRDIDHLPIHEHTTVYLESGRSDEHRPTTEVQPVIVEERAVSTDYPVIHETFDYHTDETKRKAEMDNLPIEHHVSLYSSGRSDEPKQKSAESVTSKLTSLFKRGHAHESFPTSERYEGPVSETQRYRDIEHLPIYEHATVYLESGRSDELRPSTEEQPVVVEEVIITTKPTVSSDYPTIQEPFDYRTEETRRRNEMDNLPIEHHVSLYSTGRSDEVKPATPEPSVASKLTSLFKKSDKKTDSDYPTSIHEGPVSETNRSYEATHLPIHEHATVYLQSGRSDEHRPTEQKPDVTEQIQIVTTDYPTIHEPFDYQTDETKRLREFDGQPIEHHVSLYSTGRSDEIKSATPEPSVASKLTSLFKKSDKKTESGYPTSEVYEGPVDETRRYRDIEHLPIHEHATVYLQSGRSDEHRPTTTEEVQLVDVEEVVITTKPTVSTDYPTIHEPFEYQSEETRRRSEMDGHPIEHHVSLYSSGRSDEVKSATPEPSITSKISSLFKKGEKKTESGYPSTEVYEGPVSETARAYEATQLPINEHATVYLESGRSDEHRPTTEVQPTTAEEVEIVTTDYPTIHEPFEYQTDETRRSKELDGHPIEHHVSLYSSGRSDEPKQKTAESVTSKLTSLFKKGDKKTESDYPTSIHEGPVDETRRFNDIEHLPIYEHASVYLQSGRSDEHIPSVTQPTTTEEVEIATTDYPAIHEPFEYQTDETRRRDEMDNLPIEHHVSLYSSGRSDEPKQKSAESVTSKLTSLFKRGHAHESFPTTERYEGPVSETQHQRDIEHLPIHEHATVYLTSGRSDEHQATTTEDQPVVVKEVIITTKPTVSSDYPTIHEPFEYQTDETRRSRKLDGHPIEHHVSLYSSGRSDEPRSKTPEPSVASKLSLLFKKSDKKTETGYPTSIHEGPVDEISRYRDIEHLPIHQHATVYLTSGRSDEHRPIEHKPEVTEQVEIVTTDYPAIHEPFDYQTDETKRRSEMDNLPIEHHVSLYSTGRSDEPKQKSTESVTSKLTSLFKKSDKKTETGYPEMSTYEGPVSETRRYRDIEHLPIHEHATVYLQSGRSDEHRPTTTEEQQPVIVEERVIPTDYPTIHEPFDYQTDETRRRSEMDNLPIEHHVSLYSTGRSDEPKAKTPEPSVASKLSSLFKKSDKKTETGYPEMSTYEGPVSETQRYRDIDHLPIQEHATVYLESGRSDEHRRTTEVQPVVTEQVEIVTTDYPTIHEPFEYETDETRRRSEMDNLPIEHHVSLYSTGRSDEPKQKSAESVTSKLTSLFKRGHAHESFPTSERYEGPVDETRRFNDIEHLPIHEHATVYLQSGRSDEHRPTTTEVQSVVTEQVQIVTTDYPTIHEPFEYQTDETKRRNEMDAHPIEHHVSLYSTGRSDEPKSATPEPSVASKLTSLFKKSDKKTESDYPTSIHEGPVDETRRYRDIEHLPIHEHAIVYLTSGRSDEHRPTTEVKPLVTKEVEIATTDYPAIHEPFDYQTDETRRRDEMDNLPIEHHVSLYSTGRSDEPKQKSTESVTSKLTSLFKRGHAHESFPKSERYEGPISETQHQRDIEHLPIHEHATVYLKSGRSDEHRPTERVTTAEHEIPIIDEQLVSSDYPTIQKLFDYQTDETKRLREFDGQPIEHHVSLYSTGRSDEIKSATPEPSVASKLTSLFKKSDKKTETGYPEMSTYEGSVYETRRYRDIEHLPIHEHANVYLTSGRSDEHRPIITEEVQPVVVEEQIVSTDYPTIHEPFEYQTNETQRSREFDGQPIEHHVSLYSSGRSDEPKAKTPEPSVASKLTSLFKRGHAHESFPTTERYEGPVSETQHQRDIEHLPIHEHATVYLESGRSDEHRPLTKDKPVMVEEVKIVTTDYPTIHEPFDYQTDETSRRSEMEGHPIERHVSLYSSGRSDEPKEKTAESVTSKLTSLFKKGEKKTESEYPTTEVYEGPVSDISRFNDIEHLPIHEHASVYLQSGRSDEHRPTTTEEVQLVDVEEVVITTKPTVSTDYPTIHEPFEYQSEETRRRSEMDGHPIEHHVSLYSSGRSDEVKSATPEPSITPKISSLFKKGEKKTESGYPSTEVYEGPVSETARAYEATQLPINEHATVYLESGRSDEHRPTTEVQPTTAEEVEIVTTDYPTIHEPFEYQTDETRRSKELDGHPIEHHVSLYSSGRSDEPKQKTAESVTSKLTSLFKKGEKKTETGYPEMTSYEGPVDETRRLNDIEHLPIHEHATVYLQNGRSDEHRPTTTEEVQLVDVEEVIITTKPTVSTDYPTIHEPVEYETDETRRRSEMDNLPIEHHVSLYSSGRSDEIKSATPEPSVASKLSSLFKKSDKKTETGYPTSIHEGPVNETQRYRDIDHLPIHEHATVYLQSGRSDEQRPTTTEEVQSVVVEEVVITTKPTVSTDYPAIHEPFDYQTDETRRRDEMDNLPIEHHVSLYSTGRSDEPKQKSTESVTSKLTSLFKRGHAHESFPKSERYEGPISETQHQRDIEHLPIHQHATVYLKSGRSDEHKPTTTEVQPVVTEQIEIVTTDYPTIHEPFDYQTDATRRQNEMDNLPIEQHVSLYSSGRSDEIKSKTSEPSVASKLSSLFKTSDKKTETGYPEMATYEGPVSETQRYRDIDHLPIHEHATVYLQSGRSDDYKPTTTAEVQPVIVEEVIITTKPTVSTDYPTIHEPFDYQTDETKRRSEMDAHPIEHHVSLYSTGRSDEPKSKTPEPSVASKLSSLFKKSDKKTETGYPTSIHEGPVSETSRFNDIEHLPIHEHATVYLQSGRSDEHIPSVTQPTTTEEVEIVITDYPAIHEPFEYQTDETRRRSEMDNLPIEHHVSLYSSGRSDEPKQKSAESVTSKLSSLFKKGEKKTESDYPEMSTYEGPVSETQRYRDIEHLPIHEHASVYLQSGRSDEHRPTTEVQPVVTEQVEIVTTDYPAIHEPFEYETDETRRRSEMDNLPIEHHVSLYSTGRSDEPKAKTPEPSVTSKLTSLFKRKHAHESLPTSERYEGPVDETRRFNDIEHLPIHEHATVYLQSGRSDEHRPIEQKPEVTEEVEIATTDYPVIHEPFEYQTDATRRQNEMDNLPIEQHVSLYSSGRSDEIKSKTPEPSVASKLSSLFKKSDKKTESGYPTSIHEGPVDETRRYQDIEHLPIHEHATVYLTSGRSDEHRPIITEEVRPVIVEEVIITTKPTLSSDYPTIQEPFDYRTEETRRRNEMDNLPIEHHVSLYSSGRSDEPKQKSAESVTSKLTSLFKRGHAHESFPTSERYEGPVDETRRFNDIEHLPIHEHATVYLQSGRSDEHRLTTEVQPVVNEQVQIVTTDYPTIHKPFEYQTDETKRRNEMDNLPIEHHVSLYSTGRSDEPKSATPEPSVASKLTSLFKKSDKKTESDYPTSIHEGPVSETRRYRDIEHLPIHEHAIVYLTSGRSDEHRPIQHKPEVTEQIEIVTTDYPTIHEPFDYQTDETRRRSEMDAHPIEHHVSLYSTGRSDEPKSKTPEPSVASKLSSLFKKSDKKTETGYPTSIHEGPVSETSRFNDIEHLPIHEHATVYLQSGRSDEHIPSVTQPTTTEEVEIVTTDYPAIHEPFDYQTDETRRRNEMDNLPIEHHVSLYSSGRSDEPKAKTPEPSVTSKLTSLFKRGHAHESFPTSERYEGPVDETRRFNDIEHLPIHEHATVYLTSGRSDEHQATTTEDQPVVVKEVIITTKPTVSSDYPTIHEPFEYQTDETRRSRELDGHPIEHHVSLYSSGRSDEPRSKTPEPSVASKLSSLFKRGHAHESFPTSNRYEGPISETQHQRDIEHLPIHEHATVYLTSGRSDEHRSTELKPTITTEERHMSTDYPSIYEPTNYKTDETRRSNELADYPIEHHVARYSSGRSDEHRPTEHKAIAEHETPVIEEQLVSTDYPTIREPIEYQTDETRRSAELDGHPIEKHVSLYSSGRSDKPQQSEKTSVTSKLTSLFKKGEKKTETGYPSTEVYEGPISDTARLYEATQLPLHEHATVYLQSGRSDEAPSVKSTITTEERHIHTDYPAIQKATNYKTDETRRSNELTDYPLEHYVARYSSGRYDEVKPATQEPSVTSKLSSLFKRGHAHESFPTSERYEGLISETQRDWDIEHLPIHEHATIYLQSGRSDEHRPTEQKPTTTTEERHIHTDYPTIQKATNYKTDETRRSHELTAYPIEQHATRYSSGRSDETKGKVQSPVFIAAPKNYEDDKLQYVDIRPRSPEAERHVTQTVISTTPVTPTPVVEKPVVHSTDRSWELATLPISQYCTVYNKGRSDLLTLKSTEEKSDTFSKLTTFFRRGHAHEDKPTSQRYTGKLSTLPLHHDPPELPVTKYVHIYHDSGRSDVEVSPYRRQYSKPRTDELPGYPNYRYVGHLLSISPSLEFTPRPIEKHVKLNRRPAPYSPTSERTTFDVKLYTRSPSPVRSNIPPKSQSEHEMREVDERWMKSSISTSRDDEWRRRDVSSSIDYRSEHKPRILHERPPLPVSPKRGPNVTTFHPFANERDMVATSTPDYSRTYERRSRPSDSSTVYLESSERIFAHGKDESRQKTYDRSYARTPRSLSESRRLHGWTTVTERTTLTYSRHTSMQRFEGRRRQLFTESISVHTYDHLRSPRRTFSPPLHTELDQRYRSYNRSRSQGPNESWTQTTFDASPRKFESSESRERTYRSYCSHLYDRSAIMRGYYPDEGIGDFRNGQFFNDSNHTTSSSRVHEIPVARLIDDLPNFDDDVDVELYRKPVTRTYPLESRLLEPGHHVAPNKTIPLNRTRRRVRNYCAML
ncbi:hypothetical protein M3Y95_00721500 [Aphelenchoides besseyi]|nr:hypothetical protein M3Y95_00721500 [Aphelenchoides besseyi]